MQLFLSDLECRVVLAALQQLTVDTTRYLSDPDLNAVQAMSYEISFDTATAVIERIMDAQDGPTVPPLLPDDAFEAMEQIGIADELKQALRVQAGHRQLHPVFEAETETLALARRGVSDLAR